MISILKILRGTREILSDKSVWTKGVYAKDAQGLPCGWRSSQATCFCVLGAAQRAAAKLGYRSSDDTLPAVELSMSDEFSQYGTEKLSTGHGTIPPWQDAPERTHQDVLDFLDARIKFHEGEDRDQRQ